MNPLRLTSILLLGIIFLTGCREKDIEKVVYVTPKGKCYHSSQECGTLSRSKHIMELPLSEAIESRKACRVCH